VILLLPLFISLHLALAMSLVIVGLISNLRKCENQFIELADNSARIAKSLGEVYRHLEAGDLMWKHAVTSEWHPRTKHLATCYSHNLETGETVTNCGISALSQLSLTCWKVST